MKKTLLFAVMAAAILSGCTKQFVDEPANTNSKSDIGFETYVANSTKGVAKGGFVMGDQFKVIGAKTGSNVLFDVKNPTFTDWVFKGANFADNGATVSNYGGTPEVWRYNNPVAWDNETVTFFGFSPVPTATETYGITYAAPANLTTIPSIDFAVKGGYDVAKTITDAEAIASRPLTKDQVDLLWVCMPDQSKANKQVALMFRHSLTRLSFAIRSNAPTGHNIRINSIALKNVSVDGKLALAHDESVTANPKPGDQDYLGGWVAGGTKKSFAVNLINNVASLIKDNDVHTITDGDEALMMIPQALAGVEIEVRYAYSPDGINWENYETGVPVTVKLSELATHWNPNKQIRYILNITPGEVIGFTADVQPWGTEGDIEFRSVEAGKDAQNVYTIALAAGDKFKTVSDAGWITYLEGANAAADLKSTEVTATAGTYAFAVKANYTKVAREEQIVINHANGHSTIVKVSQQPGDGIIKSPSGAGTVLDVTLAAGDKISAPQTKADAAWVLVNGNPITGDYTTEGAAAISVLENTGTKRAATFSVTIAGTTTDYVVEQAGVDVKVIKLPTAASEVITGIAADVITLKNGGGTWLTITEGGGSAVELTGIVTTAAAYTINVTENATASERTAEFWVVSGGVTKAYQITQEKTVAPSAVNVAAVGGDVLAEDTYAAGDYFELTAGGTAELMITKNSEPVEALSGKVVVNADDKYTITAKINTTDVAKTATVTVSKGGVVVVYNVTVAAAKVTTVTEIAAAANSTQTITLKAGKIKVIGAGGAHAWLKLTDSAATDVDFSTETTVAAGEATLTALSENSGSARTETIVVINDDKTVDVFNVSQGV